MKLTEKTQHLDYLDCIRGYAILMVIASHAAMQYQGLPYPVKRVATSGWFGVQLFFIASAVTLLMSWHSRSSRGDNDLQAFAIRRLFRIAPAYYLAGVLYFFLSPPLRFDFAQLLRMATFINAWSPHWLTAPGVWNVVPGGWSISVEMTFYLTFPLFALVATSLSRSIIVTCALAIAGLGANLLIFNAERDEFPEAFLSNFLFFWFPNQVSVFGIGAIVYHLIPAAAVNSSFKKISPYLAATSIICFACLTFIVQGKFLGDRQGFPIGHAAALILGTFVLAVAIDGRWLINKPVANLGKVSFSAYLLHFAVLMFMGQFAGILGHNAAGVVAILYYAVGVAIALLVTYGVSTVSAKFIERPGIEAGRRLITYLQRRKGGARTMMVQE